MPYKLQEETLRKYPFSSTAAEAGLSIQRTASLLDHLLVQKLAPYNLSYALYLVLRILREHGTYGLSSGQLAERLIAVDPDVTRLLDKLESRDLIARHRIKEDRRVILVKITEEGIKLIAPLDSVLQKMRLDLFNGVSSEEIQSCINTLGIVRDNIAQELERTAQQHPNGNK